MGAQDGVRERAPGRRACVQRCEKGRVGEPVHVRVLGAKHQLLGARCSLQSANACGGQHASSSKNQSGAKPCTFD